MSQTVARCEAAMPLDLLSAWHDREVSSDVAARVRQHVATCRACQAYLADYAAAGRAIRDFAPPPLQDAIWRDVQPATTRQSPKRATPSRGVILGGLGAAMAVVLLVTTVAFFYLGNRGHSLTVVPTGTPAATNTLAPTATVPTLKVSPSQGWVTASALASYGKWVTFAQSDPLTGYACGNGASVSQPQPLLFGTTHDGGLTWGTPVTTSVKGVLCHILINPSNAQDLIMTASGCYFCDDGFNGMYRSLDSGKSWIELELPPGSTAPDNRIGEPVYVESRLFVIASATPVVGIPFLSPIVHHIAVSQDGGPLQWLDQQSLLGNLINQVNLGIGNTFSLGGAYYVQISGSFCVQTTCPYARTIDGGKTWTRFNTPSNFGSFVPGSDNKTLYELDDVRDQMEQSINNGVTLKSLPSFPHNYRSYDFVGSTPNGTIYTILYNTNQAINELNGIYKLELGASSWSFVTPTIESGTSSQLSNSTITYVSYDVLGNPKAIWKYLETPEKNFTEALASIAISYHAP